MEGLQEARGTSFQIPHPTLIFANKPNPCHDGRYVSRSVAVVVVPFFHFDGLIWVPLGKRSSAMKDNVGLECLPCGYLDWNETIDLCAIRETWEELRLDVAPYLLGKTAYSYNSDPTKDARQNITFRFRCYARVSSTLPALVPSNEVESARWVQMEEAVKLPLAFGHDRLIADSAEWLDSQIRLQPVLKALNGGYSMPAKNTPEWHMRHRI